VLSVEPDRNVRDEACDLCHRPYRRLTLFLHRNGDPHAICHVALHRHDGKPEAWFDCILGSWIEGDPSDHVSFGCRVGEVAGQSEPAASLVEAAVPFSDRRSAARLRLGLARMKNWGLTPIFHAVGCRHGAERDHTVGRVAEGPSRLASLSPSADRAAPAAALIV
jgi:hypothetical protein